MIHAALDEMKLQLLDDSLQALHEPLDGLFVLRFSRSRARIIVSPRRARIHVTNRRFHNPSTPSAFVMRLRKHLAGTTLTAIDQIGLDRIAILTFRRRYDGDSTLQLTAELMGNRGNLILLSGGDVVATLRTAPRLAAGHRYAPPPEQSKKALTEITQSDFEEILASPAPHRALAARADGVGFETARALIGSVDTRFATEAATSLVARSRELLAACDAPRPVFCRTLGSALLIPLMPDCASTRTVTEALDEELETVLASERSSATEIHARRSADWEFAKRARIRERLHQVLAASPTPDELRHQADLLLAYGQDLARGASEFILDDPTTGQPLRIPLREDVDAVGNAQRMYRKARRLERGQAAARKKLMMIEREIEVIRAAPPPSSTIADEPALRSADAGESRPESAPRKRRFVVDGYTIDVGRSARENDELLRRASPEDLWLHARGIPGSHVFIRQRGQEEIPEHILRHAARLAVLHSKKRNEAKAEVSYTQVKHVRKPRNAPPGLVILARESTLVVTPLPRKRDSRNEPDV